jgi:hypothetical protein
LDIVSDLLALLQGGTGNRISFERSRLKVEGYFTAPHRFAASQILRVVACLRLIGETIPKLKGVIGQSIAEGLQAERRAFILSIASLYASEVALLSLLSTVGGAKCERIAACAYICDVIRAESDEESVINTLALTQNHGNPVIAAIGGDLLRLGIAVFIEFIKEWVIYGRLDDPYSEFFISKSEKKVESSDWWISKFVVISQRIPLFLVDEKLIAKIVSGGRAWNFVRKFKTLQSEIPSEGVFEGKQFSLQLVPVFSDEAMRNAMRIMTEYVWLAGHVRALHDFILFFRGDFASALFRNLNSDRRGDTLNLLLIPLQSCTNGISYTNRVTGERLTDRIDLQIKSIVDQTSMRLSYKVDSPLDSVFDPESMVNYRRLSQLLWKLKCCEYRLTANWKKARHQLLLSIIGNDGGLSRRQNIVRHKLLTTVRALNEFVSTDVVLASGKELESWISKVSDFDDLVKRHRIHVNGLMKGTLLATDFIEHYNALGLLTETMNRYADLEDEIEGIIEKMIDDIEDAENFDEDGDRYMKRIRDDLADAAFHVSQLNSEFDDRLEALFALASRKDSPSELQRLELRLMFCMSRSH